MQLSSQRLAVFLTLLAFAQNAWTQNSRTVAIDPAGESSRVSLSYMDASAQHSFAETFETPLNRDYQPYSLLLINNSGKAIVALSVRWTVTMAEETAVYESCIDSLIPTGLGGGSRSSARIRLPGQKQPNPGPLFIGQSHASASGTEVAAVGERMLVAPGLFVKESIGTPRAQSGMPDEFRRANMIMAMLDTVVLEDGEVLGPDTSRTVEDLRKRKANIETLFSIVTAAEQSGEEGIEALRKFANTPMEKGQGSIDLRMLAQSLMMSRDWRKHLEEMAAIQLPDFHRSSNGNGQR